MRSLRFLALLSLLIAASCSDDTGKQQGGNGFQLGDDLNLSIQPESVNFGAVPLNEERFVEVTLRHTGGSGILRLLDVQFVTESPDLSIEAPASTELEPGTSTTIQVRYQPSDGAHDDGTIIIETNVPRTEGGTLTYEIPVLTLQQTAEVISEPFLHDFGSVESATSAEHTFTLRNIGELPFTVDSLSFKEAVTDYHVVAAPEWPQTYASGDEFALTVAYTPEGFDLDTNWLQLNGTSLAGDHVFEVELRGHEVWGKLVMDPDVVDFGLQLPGQVHTRTVTLTNEGSTTLRIHQTDVVDISPWSHTIGIVGVQGTEEGLEIASGESLDIQVTFLPDPYMEPGTGPVAKVIFHTNDPTTPGHSELLVFGKRRGAGLEVFPPDQLYFGFVGEGGTVLRTLSLYNATTFPITIEKMWIEGEFSFLEGESWGPTLPEALPEEILSGDTKEISVIFTHAGGDWSTSWGKVQIDSNDLLKPHWEVLLQARAATQSPCILQLVPETTDFGLVIAGQSKTVPVHLVNIGGTTCAFDAAAIDDCQGEGECSPIAIDSDFLSTSAHFTLTNLPDVGSDNLPPGESLEVGLTFTAPDKETLPANAIANFQALLSLRATSKDASAEPVLSMVPDALTWGPNHNITAKAAAAQLITSPSAIDFEKVPIGCQSAPVTITATNIGLAPLGITDWTLMDCPQTFEIVDYPVLDDPTPNGALVAKLYEGESSEFLVAYEPLSEESESCTLAIHHTASNEPTLVELVGQGTYVTDQTDVFTDSATQDVDVLFVVDDSGSMAHEQQNLAKSFDSFIQKASEWKSDFQIGVVTTTLEFPDAGVLQGSPPFVTHANWEKFINNVQVGTTGSGMEQGLWAAKVALGSPTTDVTDEPCEEDGDCGFLHACMNGFCGGPNQFFIRDNASLELVFLSDEEDQSPESTDEYLKYFRAIKGFDKPDQMHIHAIVGPAGGCESDDGSAVAGHPYLELAQATGGITYSICESDFSKGLESIGEVAFSAKMRYFLTKFPAPTTLAVTIDGYPCPLLTLGSFNWTYDPVSNSVQLAENSICKAEPGSMVEIYYKLLCFAD
jgi:hypothetical protein